MATDFAFVYMCRKTQWCMKKWPCFDDVQNWTGMLDRHSLFWSCLVMSKKKKLTDILSLNWYILSICSLRPRIHYNPWHQGGRLINNQRMPIVTGAVLEIFRGQGEGTEAEVVNLDRTRGAYKAKWIHSFNKCGSSSYNVPGTVLGTRNIAVNIRDCPSSRRTSLLGAGG